VENYTTMGSVEIYYDFLNKEQSKNIIESIEAMDQDKEFPAGFEDAKVGKGHKGGEIRSNSLFPLTLHSNMDPNQREYREAIKNGTDTYFKELKEIQDLLSNKMVEFVGRYTDKYEFSIDFDEGFTLLRYKGGQEYKPHCDYAPHIPRHLSALILLNPTEYEGGGTYFEHFEENVKTEAPALILFPSNYAYSHRAMPVISGTKYAIVTWLGHPFDTDGMPGMYLPQGGGQ